MEKFFLKTTLLLVIIFTNLYCFIEFSGCEVFVPTGLGEIRLYKDIYGFHVLKDGQIYDIENCFCDQLLREMSDEQLAKFLGRNSPKIIFLTTEQFDQLIQNEAIELTDDQKDNLFRQLYGTGYISVNQLDNGAYILRSKIRLMGGVEDEDVKLAKDGARQGAKVLGHGVAIDAVIAAVAAGKAQLASAAALKAIILAGGPAAETAAAALASQASVGGAALAGGAAALITAIPVVIVGIPVFALGYVCVKKIVASSSQGASTSQTNPEKKDAEAEHNVPEEDEEPPMPVEEIDGQSLTHSGTGH